MVQCRCVGGIDNFCDRVSRMLSTGLNDLLKKQGQIKRNWNYFLMRDRGLARSVPDEGFQGNLVGFS